jgi:hypothetical protein
VRFIAYEHGGEIPLSKVLSVIDFGVHDLALKATSASLSGDYRLTDAEWAAVVIDAVLRIDRRMLVPGAAGGSRTPIPNTSRRRCGSVTTAAACSAKRRTISNSTTSSRGLKVAQARWEMSNFCVADATW